MPSVQTQLSFSSFSPENDQKKAPEPAKEEKFTGKLLSWASWGTMEETRDYKQMFLTSKHCEVGERMWGREVWKEMTHFHSGQRLPEQFWTTKSISSVVFFYL